jgi:hypothetical protein
MRLENVLALTRGSLKTDPFITSVNGIVFDVKKVKRGDLFVALEPDTIEDAVLNGAYGIIFDRPTQISDAEIAWIKVDSVKEALKRLLRFRMIDKELDVYSCDPITQKLAKQVMTSSDFVVLDGTFIDICRALWDIEPHTTVLFSAASVEEELFVSVKPMPQTAVESVTIIEQTLFETSFIYENTFYERQLLSPFFIPYLERLLHFLKTKEIVFRLRPFLPIPHFEAVFTDSSFKVKEFGASDRVLIFEPDFELIEPQIRFLKKQANWAKIIYVIPSHKQKRLQGEANIFTYRSVRDIIDILKTNDFHFALIAEQDRSLLDKPLFDHRAEQLTLDL